MLRRLEGLGIVVVALAVAIGVIALLSGGLAGGRDDPGLSLRSGIAAPGTAYRDQGGRILAAGTPRPAYDSDPPTSGPHVSAPVTRNAAPISDDQLLTALSEGDVVLLYSGDRAPQGLQAVADGVAPRFTPALARAGQAVILASRPGLDTITAVAWTRMLHSDDAGDLRGFAEHWLGHGAGPTTVVGTG